MIPPDRLEPEVVEHAAVREVDLTDEPVPVGLLVRAARERRRLVLRVHDAEGPRHARGRRDSLSQRPVAERRVAGRRAADLPLSGVEHPLLAEAHVAGEEDEARALGEVLEPSRGRALGVRLGERLALGARNQPVAGMEAGQSGTGAHIPGGERAHGLGDAGVEAFHRLSRLTVGAGQERRQLCSDDAATRDRGEGLDHRQDPELVQPAKRPEVEERRAVAAARHAERGALPCLLRQVGRDAVLGRVTHVAGS